MQLITEILFDQKYVLFVKLTDRPNNAIILLKTYLIFI